MDLLVESLGDQIKQLEAYFFLVTAARERRRVVVVGHLVVGELAEKYFFFGFEIFILSRNIK